MSARSESGRENRSRNTSEVHTPVDESLLNSIEDISAKDISAKEIEVPTMVELTQGEQDLAAEEESEVEHKRDAARQAASERGLAEAQQEGKDAEAPSSSAPGVELGEHSRDHSLTSPPQEGGPP